MIGPRIQSQNMPAQRLSAPNVESMGSVGNLSTGLTAIHGWLVDCSVDDPRCTESVVFARLNGWYGGIGMLQSHSLHQSRGDLSGDAYAIYILVAKAGTV